MSYCRWQNEESLPLSRATLNPNTCIVEECRHTSSNAQSVVMMSSVQMSNLGLFDDDVIAVKTKRNREVVAIVKSNSSLTNNTIQMSNDLRTNIR